MISKKTKQKLTQKQKTKNNNNNNNNNKKSSAFQLFSVLFTLKFFMYLLSFLNFSLFSSFPFPCFLIFLYIFHFLKFFPSLFFSDLSPKMSRWKVWRGGGHSTHCPPCYATDHMFLILYVRFLIFVSHDHFNPLSVFIFSSLYLFIFLHSSPSFLLHLLLLFTESDS